MARSEAQRCTANFSVIRTNYSPCRQPEAKCIVSVIPASAFGFDSSPGPRLLATSPSRKGSFSPPVATTNSSSRFYTPSVRNNSRPNSQRMLLAEALLGYCKAALARVAHSGPRVGLTEESGDRSDATIEFAQWRLSKIFGDCTEAAHGVLGATGCREATAWIKIAQFLEGTKQFVNSALMPKCLNPGAIELRKMTFFRHPKIGARCGRPFPMPRDAGQSWNQEGWLVDASASVDEPSRLAHV